MRHQVAQDGEGLGPQGERLLPAPQPLVDEVKPKGMEKKADF